MTVCFGRLVRGAISNIGRMLGGLGPEALPCLMPALNDGSSGVRLAAMNGIEAIQPLSATAALPIAKCLKDRNGLTRVSAAIALGRMEANAAPAIPQLIEALNDSDAGPTPRPAPVSISQPRQFINWVAVRGNAAAALGKIGPDARPAVPYLQKLLSASDPYAREQAAFALWRIAGVTNGVAVLIADLQSADRPFMCDLILRQLGQIGVDANAASAVVVKLSQAVTWPEPDPARATFPISLRTRELALQALANINPENSGQDLNQGQMKADDAKPAPTDSTAPKKAVFPNAP